MPIKMSLISLLAAILALAMIAAADEIKTDITAHQINQGFTVIYPDDYSPRLATDVVCSVQLAGDPYWGIADWLIGDEIYKTYQDPTVTGIDCEFPFEVQAVAMMLQFATGGSVVASVDIECLDSAESTPS